MNTEQEQPTTAETPCITEVPGVVNITEAAPASNDDAVEVVSTGDGIIAEVDSAALDVQDHLDAVESLDGVHAGLEAIAASLEVHGAAMDVQAAHQLRLAFESHVSRVGLKNTLPHSDNFRAGRRPHAVQLSMETIQDTLRQVWNAIIAMFKRAWSAVTHFLATMNRSGDALLKRVQDLEAKITTDYSAEGEVDLGTSIAQRLAIGNSVHELTAANMDEFVSAVLSGYINARDQCVEMEDAIKLLSQDLSDATWERLDRGMNDMYLRRARQFRKDGKGGFYLKTVITEGNKYVHYTLPEIPEALEETQIESIIAILTAMGNRGYRIESKAVEGEIKTTIKRPSAQDLKGVLNTLTKLAKEFGHADALRKISERDLQRLRSTAGHDTEKLGERHAVAIRLMVKNYSVYSHQLAVNVQYALRVGYAYADAVEKCLQK